MNLGARGAALLVLVCVVGYALVAVAAGSPRFPTRQECARPAVEGQSVDVTYGRFDDLASANELVTKLDGVGFVGAAVELDACGRWKVSYDGIESIAQGEALAEQVREAGFDARVEQEG